MGVPTSEVGYTSATTGRGDHEVHKGHVMALEKKTIEMCVRYGIPCGLQLWDPMWLTTVGSRVAYSCGIP
jgi:hypothetical protein